MDGRNTIFQSLALVLLSINCREGLERVIPPPWSLPHLRWAFWLSPQHFSVFSGLAWPGLALSSVSAKPLCFAFLTTFTWYHIHGRKAYVDGSKLGFKRKKQDFVYSNRACHHPKSFMKTLHTAPNNSLPFQSLLFLLKCLLDWPILIAVHVISVLSKT